MTYTDNGHVITMMSLANYRKWKQSKLDKMREPNIQVCIACGETKDCLLINKTYLCATCVLEIASEVSRDIKEKQSKNK